MFDRKNKFFQEEQIITTSPELTMEQERAQEVKEAYEKLKKFIKLLKEFPELRNNHFFYPKRDMKGQWLRHELENALYRVNELVKADRIHDDEYRGEAKGLLNEAEKVLQDLNEWDREGYTGRTGLQREYQAMLEKLFGEE